MNRPRISILGLMGIILVAGLLFALVRIEKGIVLSGLEIWVNLARYLSITMLVIGTYRAKYRNGREADWWFGFALAGWAYCLFSGDMVWQSRWPVHLPDSLVRRLPYWIVDQIPTSWIDRIILSYSFRPAFEIRSYVTRLVQTPLLLFVASMGGFVCLMLSWRRQIHSTGGNPPSH